MDRVTCHQTTKNVPKVSCRLTHLALGSRCGSSQPPAVPAPCSLSHCWWVFADGSSYPCPSLDSLLSCLCPDISTACAMPSMLWGPAVSFLLPFTISSTKPLAQSPVGRADPLEISASTACPGSQLCLEAAFPVGDAHPLFPPIGTHCPNPWVMLHLHPLSIPRTSLEVPTAPRRSPLHGTASPRGLASHPLEHHGGGHRV